MRESEAYALQGWPMEGRAFILPATGSTDDHTAYRCRYCDWRGVAVTSYFETMSKDCDGCGRANSLVKVLPQ